MKKAASFIAIAILIIAGCQREFDSETQAHMQFMTKHLAPGFTSFSFDDEVNELYWHIEAVYDNTSAKELVEFYADFARTTEWEKLDIGDEGAHSSLMLEQPKALMNIDIQESGPRTTLTISYFGFKWSHEEFQVLVEESQSSDAREIVEKVLAAYGELTSYSDTGSYTMLLDGEPFTELKFETRYGNGEDLYFEYSESIDGLGGSWAALRSAGGEVISTGSYFETEEYDDVSMAIAALYGVSSTTSGNIPEILLNLEGQTLFNLANLSLLEGEALPDGTRCMRLQGNDFNDDQLTIWVDQENHLIRKIETIGIDSSETISVFPKLNPMIPLEGFELRQK